MPQIPYILRVSLIFITNSVVQTNPSHTGRITNHRHCSLSIHFNNRFSFNLAYTVSLHSLLFHWCCAVPSSSKVYSHTQVLMPILAILISFSFPFSYSALSDPWHLLIWTLFYLAIVTQPWNIGFLNL